LLCDISAQSADSAVKIFSVSDRDVERQKPVPLIYETVKLECGFRADIVVNRRVAVELKCKDALHPVDEAQLLSHLRLLNLPIGILINFHVVLLKDGIRRLVNNYVEPAEASSEKLLTAEFAESMPVR
jgi:GxxExxY protein